MSERLSYRTAAPRASPSGSWRPLIALGLALLTVAMCVTLVLALAARLDPLDRAQRVRQAERQSRLDARLVGYDLVLTAAWRAVPLLLVVGGAAVAGVIAYRRWGSAQAVAEHYRVHALRAEHQHPNVPQTFTFSPHLAYRNNTEGLLPDLGAVARLPAPAPVFRALLDQGTIATGQPLILGADTTSGELVEGSFKSLYSTGLGGLQGSGKTWTASFLLAQSALQGARLVIVDPQLGDDETLSTRVAGLAPAFLCDVASAPGDILAALRLVDDELKARERGAAQRWPVIVAIDEWLSLRRGELGDVLPLLVERLATTGRKYNVNAMLLSQRWDKAAAGEGRNTLTSAYVHRLRPDEARMLTGLRAAALPDDTLLLPPGVAYLMTTSGELRRVAIPRMVIADIAEVGQRLGGGTYPAGIGGELAADRQFGFRAATSRQPPGNQSAINAELTSSASERAQLDPESARIVALFLQGLGIPEITREVFGVSTGRAYTEARARVEQILRAALAA
jgi:hypothetical protein